MKKYLFITFLFSVLFANAQQQTFSKVFYNGIDNIQAYDLVRSADNHYFIAGTGFVTKTDSAGNTEWTKNYYTGMQTKFNCIQLDFDGNLVLAGYSNDGDALIMKMDQNGDTLWSKFVDFGHFSEAFSVSQVHDSGYVICGYVYNATPSSPMFVARLSSNGNLIWSNTYAISDHADYAYSVKETPDSGFIIAGYAENYPPYESFAVALKLNETGSAVWCKGFSQSSGVNLASDVCIVGSDLLVGCTIDNVYQLVKTDSIGNIIWSKTQMFYASTGLNLAPTKIRKINGDRFMMILASDMYMFGPLIVCDSAGNQLSANSIMMYGSSVVETADSGYMVLGNGPLLGVKSDPKNITSAQFVLVKTDSLSNTSMCNDPMPANSASSTLTTTVLLPVSTVAGTLGGLSFVVTDLMLAVANECVGFIGGFGDEGSAPLAIFPNPSNGAFTLQFDNPKVNEECVIEVYNPLGVCVYNAREKIRNEIFLDLKELNSGLYFVVVTAEGESMSRVVEIRK